MAGGGNWRLAELLAITTTLMAGCASRQPPQLMPPHLVASTSTVFGTASWYGPGFDGHRTSSGVVYNQEDFTAASVMFPLGSIVRVTDLANGRAVNVTINDHGPYLHGRAIDLSHRAALALGMIGPGTAPVRMDVIASPAGGPPLGMRYFVQVGSYANPANAERMRMQVARYYPDATIVEASAGDAHYYRVRMGAFIDHDMAAARAARLAELGYPAEIITE
jgi:peptidoglycan lytic transglycosylase